MVVANRVRGDSRVEKIALTAHNAGYDVTVLGIVHRTAGRVGAIEAVPILRLSPEVPLHRRRQRSLRLPSTERLDPATQERIEEIDAWSHSWERGLRVEAEEEKRRSASRGAFRRTLSRRYGLAIRTVRLVAHRAKDFARVQPGKRLRATASRGWVRLAPLPRRQGWRSVYPYLADLEVAMSEAIIDLEPDLIHVHDFHPLPAAVQAGAELRDRGRSVSWLYDAHEWVPGVATDDLARRRGADLCERNFIGLADAVITVSTQMSSMIAGRHHLLARPTVILNAPASEPTAAEGRETLRDELGLDESTPLLVYSGALSRFRGVSDVVKALPHLNGVHLAVVCLLESATRRDLEELAASLGVESRLHFTAYVPAPSVTWYLASATLGMAPFTHMPSHEVSLGTKIREYLHAGLPIVSSDVKTTADFVHDQDIGTVFTSGDPESCASAIADALNRHSELSRNITPQLLADHSWEAQEATLLELYRKLAGRPGPVRAGTASRRRFGLLDGGSSTASVENALTSSNSASDVPLFRVIGNARSGRDRSWVEPSSSSLRESLRSFAETSSSFHSLLIPGLGPVWRRLFDDLHDTHSALLAEGVQPHRLVAAEEVRQWYTSYGDGGWWEECLLGHEALQRAERQARRNATRISGDQSGAQYWCSDPQVAGRLPDVAWLPTSIPDLRVPDEALSRDHDPGDRRPVVVYRVPSREPQRVAETRSQLERLERSGQLELFVAADSDDIARFLAKSHATVLIDHGQVGTYGVDACRAMALGVPVAGSIEPSTRTAVGDDLPVIDLPLVAVAESLLELLDDHERLDSLSTRGRRFVARTHTSDALLSRLLSSLTSVS